MATMEPAGWRNLLERKINDRWFTTMGAYDAYYEGDQPLTFATAKFREAFGSLFGPLADNWMRIVVDSSAERLHVQGFRFGKNAEADDDAWGIWQANGLDLESGMVHTEAIKLGEAYWLVWPGEGRDDPPQITAEHPSQMIVAIAPGNRRERLAALKKWVGDDGYVYATLYLPDRIWKWKSRKAAKSYAASGKVEWVDRRDDPGGVNPLGEVPVVPVQNAPSMLRGGQSDLITGIPLQNAINKLLCDMLIGSEYQAFPQRVAIGLDLPRDPDTGQPTRAAQLQASQSRLMVIKDKDGKIAEFSAADLDNYVKARRHLVEHLTAQTKTPPHYVTGQLVNVSGDALKAAETGLVSKCKDKTVSFGEGHEETMRLALKATKREVDRDSETIWRDVESRSFGELIDGLVKLDTIGVPRKVLWAKAGFSPQEIARMETMQAADDLLGTAVDEQAIAARQAATAAVAPELNGTGPVVAPV